MVEETMKILICAHRMEIGGAERALLGLLYSIDYSEHQVDLFLCSHGGEFMPMLPSQVNLLPQDRAAAAIEKPIKDVLTQGLFGIALGRTIGKFISLFYNKLYGLSNSIVAIENSNRFTFPFVKRINGEKEYDLLISFTEPHYIAAYKSRAKRKIAWMHTDYSAVGLDAKAGLKIWGKYDVIAAISDSCMRSFCSIFPTLSDKVQLVENPIVPSLIRAQADEFSAEKEMSGEVILLSIGRFAYAKNFDNIPEICSRIRASGINAKWFIIGYGSDEDLIRRRISENHMEESVIILGKKTNPYPYIAACDLYIQPSRYEGKSITVQEAQILGKPVVITDYPTSSSQLEDGVDGIIAPSDNEGCAAAIIQLLGNPKRLQQIIGNCKSRNYDDKSEVTKILSL